MFMLLTGLKLVMGEQTDETRENSQFTGRGSL